MIALGLKIGFVAFVACVTFATLIIFLLTVMGVLSRDYRSQRKRESDKVTPMPKREDK